MTYRDDLDALSARHAALEREVAAKAQELAQTSRLLEEARARARLPVLDNVGVAAPCSADWEQMTGDDRVRYCGDCRKNVYNLSALTRDEAEALIVGLEGRLCVRYFQRADGTILLGDDCAVGVRRRRRRRRIVAGAAALLAGAGALGWKVAHEAHAAHDAHETTETTETTKMGQISIQHAPPAVYERLGKYEGALPDSPSTGAPAAPSDGAAPATPVGERFE